MRATFLAAASDIVGHLSNAGQNANYQAASNGAGAGYALTKIIMTVIASALGLTGTIVLALIVYAGYTWMTAGGDSDKVSKAKETIARAVIGLAIVIVSYALANFIVPLIVNATQ